MNEKQISMIQDVPCPECHNKGLIDMTYSSAHEEDLFYGTHGLKHLVYSHVKKKEPCKTCFNWPEYESLKKKVESLEKEMKELRELNEVQHNIILKIRSSFEGAKKE